MAEVDIYTRILDYMCENYDYSLYATDLDTRSISLLQRSIATVPIKAGESRNYAIKTALQDFFNAIFQKIFVYEDEDRLKIVKYFDKGAYNEEQDKQIHALRLELVKYKNEVELSYKKNFLYMFDQASRRRFEIVLLYFPHEFIKDIIRDQIGIVYDLENRDIVVFLNAKIFFKKFTTVVHNEVEKKNKLEILDDKRFIDALWLEIQTQLNQSFNSGFEFLNNDAQSFYEKYPQKFFAIIIRVIKSSFVNISEEDAVQYANAAFKNYLQKMLTEVAHFVFHEVLENKLKAIKFLKFYSESTKIINNKMKLEKKPMMDESGKIYRYQNILTLLKQKELLTSKITHKKIELKNLQQKIKKSLYVVQRSEDEMDKIQKRRFELLLAIEKVEDEIALQQKSSSHNLSLNRLEFSKRDLLEAFKQVEVRSRTQINIINNAHNELERWEEKRHQKNILKLEQDDEYLELEKEYKILCEIFATVLSKEPFEF